ncbi:MAG TPA: hypothetical protein ENI87_14480 [bacterium]|nr:hypothetical protein [bacterium]
MAFLGLDIGGSKARFEWWPASAHPGGDAPAVHPAVDREQLPERLRRLVRDAAEQRPTACVVALAGADAQLCRDLPAELGFDFPVAVVGDVMAAAAAGLRDETALLLWSGTGSFAIARGSHGELRRVGGRGFMFSDEGSGYDLVRRAIVAVVRAVDGRGPDTSLRSALTAAFAASGPERLGAVAQSLPPREVAARLPVVLREFAADDAVAHDVLVHGMRQLVELGEAALRSVGRPATDGMRVALGGGVLSGSDVVREGLVRLLQAALGCRLEARVLTPRDAALGAAWLAHGWHQRQQPAHAWVERVAL